MTQGGLGRVIRGFSDFTDFCGGGEAGFPLTLPLALTRDTDQAPEEPHVKSNPLGDGVGLLTSATLLPSNLLVLPDSESPFS